MFAMPITIKHNNNKTISCLYMYIEHFLSMKCIILNGDNFKDKGVGNTLCTLLTNIIIVFQFVLK